MAEKEAIMKLIEARREMNDLGTEEAVTNFEDASIREVGCFGYG